MRINIFTNHNKMTTLLLLAMIKEEARALVLGEQTPNIFLIESVILLDFLYLLSFRSPIRILYLHTPF